MSGIQFNTNSTTQNSTHTDENISKDTGVKRSIDSVQPSVEVNIKSIMSRDSAAKRSKQEKDGDYYFDLYVNTTDDAKADVYLQKAANLEHPEALYNLGIKHYEINDDPEHLAKAIHYLEVSAELNFTPAKVILGFIYNTEPSIHLNADIRNRIIELWTEAAEENDMTAQLYLGIHYRKGELVNRDLAIAKDYLIKAASQGSAEAQFYLGMVHIEFPEFENPRETAFKCFLNAAQKGHIKANHQLGVMFELGFGTEINIQKAIAYYQIAADHNFNPSSHKLGCMYLHGINTPEDYDKGMFYLERASDNGYGESQLELGLVYKEEKELETAIAYLTKAAEQYAEAQFELAEIYEMTGPHQNLTKAYFWFQEAAKNGYEEAAQKMLPKRIAPRASKSL